MKVKPAIITLLLFHSVLHAEWRPVEGRIMTRWAKELTPHNAWDEYPRPLLQRSQWVNLNGLWNYAITPMDADKPSEWGGEILVPFAPESALSGVGKLLQPDQALWYKRSITAAPIPGKRTILHFEAVDYDSTVWINGTEIGRHTGGHTPFSFDITGALKPGTNEVVLRVRDATGGYQLVGKQHQNPGWIWYTRVSGIWQSVWMEEVNDRSIDNLHFQSNIRSGTITVTARLSGKPVKGEKLRVTATDNGALSGSAEGTGNITLRLKNPQLWSPAAPNLYDLKVELSDHSGSTIDSVTSYAALREIGKTRDKNGNLRFTLNGKPIFHWGPLDQGWWPDGLLTPPSDEAMLSDIEYLKNAGFNMIRKHIKIEPRRYYYHCDRLGMLLWQDQVSMGYGPNTNPKGSNPRWIQLASNPRDGDWPDEAHRQFVLEYKRMVDHLRDQPCIAVWTPFNEAWGQHRTMDVGNMAVEYDKTRHVNIASGGNFFNVGDVADHHAYPHPNFPLADPRFNDFIKVVGEFGGHGMPIEGHLWDPNKRSWGYGGLPKTLDEWKQRYKQSIDILRDLRRNGVAAGVYTQTTDVEGEINGLLTYDRTEKVPASWLKPLHEQLLATPDAATYSPVMQTSEATPLTWRYTLDQPPTGWQNPGFDAKSWSVGNGGFGTRGTVNAKIGTSWDSQAIWLRREFDLRSKPKGALVLRIHHDEDAIVFLNGIRIADLAGFTTHYVIHRLEESAKSALKQGKNVLAVHVKQTIGGQFIDAGIFEETADR